MSESETEGAGSRGLGSRGAETVEVIVTLTVDEAARIDAVADRQGLSRTDFLREAASRYADRLDRDRELTAAAEAALARAGQPAGSGIFLAESQRVIAEEDE
ncbi:ribbon-helix-helix protein, CopG family [Demequina sp. NBRC 110054]|uniref:ribbon-helix-helix protein, CopG family n=1 Tax=Demequina sp. NBRC 110054 TaxID=1570343 RepID=UPI0013563CB5|nr:ribbon-helix-helix domain-containing protein [Demequina sp. NBRC 110054]